MMCYTLVDVVLVLVMMLVVGLALFCGIGCLHTAPAAKAPQTPAPAAAHKTVADAAKAIQGEAAGLQQDLAQAQAVPGLPPAAEPPLASAGERTVKIADAAGAAAAANASAAAAWQKRETEYQVSLKDLQAAGLKTLDRAQAAEADLLALQKKYDGLAASQVARLFFLSGMFLIGGIALGVYLAIRGALAWGLGIAGSSLVTLVLIVTLRIWLWEITAAVAALILIGLAWAWLQRSKAADQLVTGVDKIKAALPDSSAAIGVLLERTLDTDVEGVVDSIKRRLGLGKYAAAKTV